MRKPLELFIDILCGDLDNREQVEAEQKMNKQVHPYAKHITRVCDHKVKNLPSDLLGHYILEESYYSYPDREMEIKPLLFFIREKDGKSVQLQSLVVPDKYEKAEVINTNDDLIFDYHELRINQKFGVAEYVMHDSAYFTTDHHCDFGDDVTFRLIETLSAEHLLVLELYSKAGKILTPYNTPIIYKTIR